MKAEYANLFKFATSKEGYTNIVFEQGLPNLLRDADGSSVSLAGTATELVAHVLLDNDTALALAKQLIKRISGVTQAE